MVRHRLLTSFALSVLAACAGADARTESTDDSILPNSAIFELGHDTTTYRKIAAEFASRGYDLNVDVTKFAPVWPLTDPKPSALNRHGTPMLYAGFGYVHTGLDVVRSDAAVSKDVVAPHDGVAMVFDWSGNPIKQVVNPYATIVAIYDPTSHVLTQLLHVGATAALAQAPEPTTVTKGSVIGKLAPAPLANVNDSLRLANTQVAFIDGANSRLLNPAGLFAEYTDTVAPESKGVYVTNASGQVTADFGSDKFDLVVEAFDRDDVSKRNFEVAAVAFTVKDQDGEVVSESTKCELDSLYSSIAEGSTFKALDVVDFGSAVAAGQVMGAWPNSDVDNTGRTFRYALTNLAVVNGKCTARPDADAALAVAETVTKLDVSVTLWDAKGNESTTSFEVLRAAGAPVEVDAGPGDDDDDDDDLVDGGP